MAYLDENKRSTTTPLSISLLVQASYPNMPTASSHYRDYKFSAALLRLWLPRQRQL